MTATVPPLTTLDSRLSESVGGIRYVVGVEGAPRLRGDVPPVQVVHHTDFAERTESREEVALPFVEDVRQLTAASRTGEVVVQPGTPPNFENGSGFFGAGYRLLVGLCVPSEEQETRCGD